MSGRISRFCVENTLLISLLTEELIVNSPLLE